MIESVPEQYLEKDPEDNSEASMRISYKALADAVDKRREAHPRESPSESLHAVLERALDKMHVKEWERKKKEEALADKVLDVIYERRGLVSDGHRQEAVVKKAPPSEPEFPLPSMPQRPSKPRHGRRDDEGLDWRMRQLPPRDRD